MSSIKNVDYKKKKKEHKIAEKPYKKGTFTGAQNERVRLRRKKQDSKLEKELYPKGTRKERGKIAEIRGEQNAHLERYAKKTSGREETDKERQDERQWSAAKETAIKKMQRSAHKRELHERKEEYIGEKRRKKKREK